MLTHRRPLLAFGCMTDELAIDAGAVEVFRRDGYLKVEGLVPADEIARHLAIYDRLLRGEIDAGHRRSDLGGAGPAPGVRGEKITQIMWPSDLVPDLTGSIYYRRALAVARRLLGDDLSYDFDKLIDKAPFTGTTTPWHQDLAYWIDLPDRRAVSSWLALDRATVENGCMWFVPGSHLLPLRRHVPFGKGGGALICDATEAEAVAVPLRPGSCTFHHGGTVHYSRGNRTGGHRRAMIVNYRAAAMIELERQKGFDHGRTVNRRELRNAEAR